MIPNHSHLSGYFTPFDASRHSRRESVPVAATARTFAGHSTARLIDWKAPNGFAAPLVLQCTGIGPGNPFFGGTGLAGRSDTNAAQWSTFNSGLLALNYGAGGAGKTRLIDIRNGTYQLPPCEACSVEMWKWDESGTGFPEPVHVGVSLSPGVTALPSEAVVTCVSPTMPAAQTDNLVLYPGARYVNAGSPEATCDLTVGGTALSQEMNITAGQRQPTYPRVDVNPAALWDTDTIDVTNNSAGALLTIVQQFIDL